MSVKSRFKNTLDYWFDKERKNAIKRPNSRQKRREEIIEFNKQKLKNA